MRQAFVVAAIVGLTQLSGCFFIFIPLGAFRAPEARAPAVATVQAPCSRTAYSEGDCHE
jgi:hypothetical protein